MTLTPPPPPSPSRSRRRPDSNGVSPAVAMGIRKVKHSDVGVPGMDSMLASLVDLWEDGYSAPTATLPLVTGPFLRWVSIKYARIMLLALKSHGEPPSTLPESCHGFWRNPRLSALGIAIGSSVVARKARHLDIDWFGPPGEGATNNWWRPTGTQVDGAQAEFQTCLALLKYLERSINLGESDQSVDSWSWPEGMSQPTGEAEAIAALFSEASDAAFLSHVANHAPREVRIEWRISDRNSSAAATQFTFNIGNDGITLVITTPDADGPDRY